MKSKEDTQLCIEQKIHLLPNKNRIILKKLKQKNRSINVLPIPVNKSNVVPDDGMEDIQDFSKEKSNLKSERQTFVWYRKSTSFQAKTELFWRNSQAVKLLPIPEKKSNVVSGDVMKDIQDFSKQKCNLESEKQTHLCFEQ